MIRLNIQDELSDSWQSLIERQIDMTLSPVRASLRSAQVSFSAVPRLGSDSISYLCELQGRGIGGETYYTRAQHTDGQTAIVDAFARARRDIARQRQRASPSR
jgi:hypothetical protein